MRLSTIKCTLFLLVWVLLITPSCQVEDKTCEAGNPGLFGAFPYSLGETVVFEDSLKQHIQVKFNETYNNSGSYTIKGKNALSKGKIQPCIRSSGIDAQVTSNPDTLLRNNKYFSFTFELNEDNPSSGSSYSYLLSAFQSVYITASIANGEFSPYRATRVPSFSTPSKTYSNLWLSRYRNLQQVSNYVYDSRGKLIAFTINNDTTHYYYVVE